MKDFPTPSMMKKSTQEIVRIYGERNNGIRKTILKISFNGKLVFVNKNAATPPITVEIKETVPAMTILVRSRFNVHPLKISVIKTLTERKAGTENSEIANTKTKINDVIVDGFINGRMIFINVFE